MWAQGWVGQAADARCANPRRYGQVRVGGHPSLLRTTAVGRGRALPYDTGSVVRRDGELGLRDGSRFESSPNDGTMLKVVLARGDAFPACNHGNWGLVEPVVGGLWSVYNLAKENI